MEKKSLHRYMRLIGTTWLSVLVMLVPGQTFFSSIAPPFVETSHPSLGNLFRTSTGSFVMSVRNLNSDPNGGTIVKLDANGDLTYAKRMKTSTSDPWQLRHMALTSSNSVIATKDDTLEQISPGHVRVHFRLIKISSGGSLTWSKPVGMDLVDTLYYAGTTAIAVDDQSIFVAGFNDDLPFIFRFDPSGNLDWIRRLVDPVYGVSTPTRLVADGSGGCYFMAPQDEYPDPYRSVIGHFNASGTLTWCHQYDQVALNISWTPLHLFQENSGNLLFTGSAYTTGIQEAGILMELTSGGSVNWVKKYVHPGWTPSLTVYRAGEIQGGHLLLDWQDGGFGFTELTSTGAVLGSSYMRYHDVPSGMHVVGWNEWTTHDSELSIPIWYLIDDGDFPYPTAPGLINMDLSGPGFCINDTITIEASSIPISELEILSTTTSTAAVASSASSPVMISNESFLSFEDLCSTLLGMPEPTSTETQLVQSTLLRRGVPVTISAVGVTRIDVFNAHGSLVKSCVPRDRTIELSTDDWTPGLFIVVANYVKDPLRTARIVVQ